MSDGIDRELLAERSATVLRHTRKRSGNCPTPASCPVISRIGSAGFRNLLVHAYGRLDLTRVHAIASSGPADLRAFLLALRDTGPAG